MQARDARLIPATTLVNTSSWLNLCWLAAADQFQCVESCVAHPAGLRHVGGGLGVARTEHAHGLPAVDAHAAFVALLPLGLALLIAAHCSGTASKGP